MLSMQVDGATIVVEVRPVTADLEVELVNSAVEFQKYVAGLLLMIVVEELSSDVLEISEDVTAEFEVNLELEELKQTDTLATFSLHLELRLPKMLVISANELSLVSTSPFTASLP